MLPPPPSTKLVLGNCPPSHIPPIRQRRCYSSNLCVTFRSTELLIKKSPKPCIQSTMTALPINLTTSSLLRSLPPISRTVLRSSEPTKKERNLRYFEVKWGVSLTGRRRREKELTVVRAEQGFGDRGRGAEEGGLGGRVLSNLALAVGLTYLTMSGKLGWVLDAVASIWLFAVLLSVAGLGAFFWFAGRDIVQDNCPNCGNIFQIFKSSLKDGPQLCPFCTQPFSVQDNQFVREMVRFSSNRATQFRQVFSDFAPCSEKGKTSSAAVVDIEAEVRDID